MKKTIFACAAIACAILFASCSSDIAEEKKVFGGKITLKASQEQFGGESTRTALADDRKSVNWSADDEFSVFTNVNNVNNRFAINDAGSSISPFTGEVPDGTTKMYGLYPYNVSASISDNVISGAVVPAVQHAVEGGFDPQAAIMTACTTNDNIDFKQVCCLIEVTTEYPCKKIVFSSNGSEKVAGTVSLNVADNGIATYNVTANGSTDVTLVPTVEESSIPAGTYHIAVLPQTFASGFTIRCYKTGDTSLYRKDKGTNADFHRAEIINMGDAYGSSWHEHKAVQHVYEKEAENSAPKAYVDFGDAGKWAKCNLGANEPWEYGDYYAWGATVPWIEEYHIDPLTKEASICSECKWNSEHNSYDCVNTPFQTENTTEKFSTKFTKYLGSKTSSYKDPSATDEDALKTELDPEDDAARYQWGSEWRMPSTDEHLKLGNEAYWVWTNDYDGKGIKGYIVYVAKDSSHKGKRLYGNGTGDDFTALYSLSDPHIFFPAAGCCIAGSHYNSTSYGYYWSATVVTSNPFAGRSLYFSNGYVHPKTDYFYFYFDRYHGFPVRPIKK